MKNTRIAQAVAQAEREAAAAAAHAAESAERAAKQKGHTHVPPEAPSTTGGTTNAPPSKPALQRMSTQAIQAKVKSKWAFRAAVAGLIFALPSLALHVVPMVWTGYLWSRSVKGMSFLHALASVDTNAQCDTGVQTFLYWTALLSLFLNVNRLLCRGVLPCLDSMSQEGKEEEDTLRLRNGCVSGCECALSPCLFCVQIYGMFQVFGTNATKCDPEMWQGAFYYLIYAFSAIFLAAAFTFCTTFCLRPVWAAMVVSAAMEIEEERAKRPPPLSEPLLAAP